MMKYLSRFMRKPSSEGYITVKEITQDGYDHNGMEKLKFTPVKMFQVKNGAVMIHNWWIEKEQYFSGDAYSPEKAIEVLRETIEVY